MKEFQKLYVGLTELAVGVRACVVITVCGC